MFSCTPLLLTDLYDKTWCVGMCLVCLKLVIYMNEVYVLISLQKKGEKLGFLVRIVVDVRFSFDYMGRN